MPKPFPVLSIVGTTAVGKTEFAFLLADALENSKKFKGFDIISADSRQIYQGLEILSGADIPEGFTAEKNLSVSAFRFFQKGQFRLFGVSCILPDQEWSVSQFQDYSHSIIERAQKDNRAVLLVGGTGLYHQHLFNPDSNLHVPPNTEFRELAKNLSVTELQTMLDELDSDKMQSMNNSDQNNPRRLVRAIEIAGYQGDKPDESQKILSADHHYLGLMAALETIIPKIQTRIQKRIDAGVLEEVSTVREKYGDRLNKQVISTLGFEQLAQVLEDKISIEQAIERWSLSERQYAQRQLTWWRARKDVDWFAVDQLVEWRKQALKHALQLFNA